MGSRCQQVEEAWTAFDQMSGMMLEYQPIGIRGLFWVLIQIQVNMNLDDGIVTILNAS